MCAELLLAAREQRRDKEEAIRVLDPVAGWSNPAWVSLAKHQTGSTVQRLS